MTPDSELLGCYARTRSEDAFAELVRRHANLVYSAALRQVNGDAHLAKDVSQTVFVDLARKAASLARRESLTGWLYTSTRFAAAKIVRTENRRRNREDKFMREPIQEGEVERVTPCAPDWEKIRPALDAAMHELKETDREVILLRYFENQPFAEIGARLGLNESAARMRVERTLEKLHTIFARRGIATTAALASVISANAVQMAPAGLATTLATAAAATVGTGTAVTFLNFMTAAHIKLGLSALVVAGAATAVVVEHRIQTRLHGENESLQQQVSQLEANNLNLSNRLATAGETRSLTDEQLTELMKLRGEIGVMQRQLDELGKLRGENQRLREAKLQASDENTVMASALAKFKANESQVINTMKQLGVAERIYGNDNNGQYATNFDQMTNALGGLYKNQLSDNVEFVNAGVAGEQYPQMIIFRERNPRQSPDGTWQRVYGLADGSVQVAGSPNGNFKSWEKYDSNEKGIIFSQPPDLNQ